MVNTFGHRLALKDEEAVAGSISLHEVELRICELTQEQTENDTADGINLEAHEHRSKMSLATNEDISWKTSHRN